MQKYTDFLLKLAMAITLFTFPFPVILLDLLIIVGAVTLVWIRIFYNIWYYLMLLQFN